MDIVVFVLRLFFTATFLIMAVGMPVLIVLFRRFTKMYYARHIELLDEVKALRQRITTLEHPGG